MSKKKDKEEMKAVAAAKAAEAKEAAGKAAQDGKKEGVKKIGYLGRGIKGAYLQKFGNVQLTEEEAKRRAEYMQPLLDGLKQAKEQYSTVKDAATAAIENATESTGAAKAFGEAMCNTEYLKASPVALALPQFIAAQRQLDEFAQEFVTTLKTEILDVVSAGVEKVNGARDAKVAYYDARQNYDACLSKLRDNAKKLDGLEEAKLEKAQQAFVDSQTAFAAAEQKYREAEAAAATAATDVLRTKGAHDINFLATLIQAQEIRATKSKAVLEALQPELDALPVPPPPALTGPAAPKAHMIEEKPIAVASLPTEPEPAAGGAEDGETPSELMNDDMTV